MWRMLRRGWKLDECCCVRASLLLEDCYCLTCLLGSSIWCYNAQMSGATSTTVLKAALYQRKRPIRNPRSERPPRYPLRTGHRPMPLLVYRNSYHFVSQLCLGFQDSVRLTSFPTTGASPTAALATDNPITAPFTGIFFAAAGMVWFARDNVPEILCPCRVEIMRAAVWTADCAAGIVAASVRGCECGCVSCGGEMLSRVAVWF